MWNLAGSRRVHNRMRVKAIQTRDVMRRLPLLLLLALPGCSTYELLTDSCNVEYIELSWPVTIERGASSSNAALFKDTSR